MAGIHHDAGAGTWLIEGRETAYAFALGAGGGALRHLHWGARLVPADVPALAEAAGSEPGQWERSMTWSRELPEEYVGWGGLRFDEPTLKVDFPDGTRAIEWAYRGQRVSREGDAVTLEVDLADAVYPLEVTLCYRVHDGFDVLERWARLRHAGRPGAPGAGTVVVRQAHSANWWLPARPGWRLRWPHGGWGAEMQVAETHLAPGKVVYESRRGTTSHQHNPWWTLDPEGRATEEAGEVWSGALAWSGNWKLVVETTSARRTHVSGGWNDFDWSAHLGPGQELRLPAFAALHTTGGFGAASREWHAWQLAHVLPRPAVRGPRAHPGAGPAGVPLRPVLYNSWEATHFEVSEAGQAQLAERAAEMGVELFTVDDGWFVGRGHDRAGLGDWVVDRQKFPRGLGALAERVNGLGMGFGLWLEPEMVNPDSDLYRAHPDWVYHFENRARSEHRNQLVLNLARPDVAEWVRATLDGLLSEHPIDFVKWDMNRHFSEPGWPAEAGRNPERIWVDHVENLYGILDALRAAHPGVTFESCSGGGGRVDLGILRRVDEVWTSDNTDAWDRLLLQDGFGQVYATQAMAAWVTDVPNQQTTRSVPLRFRFHVAMAGTLGVGGDLNRWSPEELAEGRELVARYKEIRPTVQQGRLYRLAPAASGGAERPFVARQYVAPDGSDVAVFAWWGPHRLPDVMPRRLRLAGLDPAAEYRVAGGDERHRGSALLAEGLPLLCRGDYGSVVTHLVRV